MITKAQSLYYIFILVRGQNCYFDIELNNWGVSEAWNRFQIKINNNNSQQTYIVFTVLTSDSTNDQSIILSQTSQMIWKINSSIPNVLFIFYFTQYSVQINFSIRAMYITDSRRI